jgi:hypothetical protein
MADTAGRELIYRVCYQGDTIEEVAASVGLDRSTVSRGLTRFYGRVLSRGWLFRAIDRGNLTALDTVRRSCYGGYQPWGRHLPVPS